VINLAEILDRNAWRDPRGEAIIDPASGRRTTHAKLRDRSVRLANAYTSTLGLQQGDRAAVLSRNAAEHLEIFFAGARTGVITVPLNWRLSPPELLRVLEDSQPRVVIFDGEFAEVVALLDGQFDAEHWIRFDQGTPSAYEDLLASQSGGVEVEPKGLGDDDPFMMLYTGGTTGQSKGVLHSHRSVYTAMLNQDASERVTGEDVYLLLGQMFHIPVVLAMNYLWRGRPVVLLNFEPEAALAVIEQERVSAFLGVTTMLNYLLAVEDLERYDLSSLRLVQYGGGPMGEDVVREALERLPCELQQGYGMTEGGSMTFLPPEVHRDAVAGIAPHRLRSCGREAFLSSVRVVDDNGVLVPRDGETIGEIVTRSDANMLGYWRNPEETASTIRNGWLHSGDVATWDEDGFLYIKDRKKEMVISGGENIYPAQVENVLYRHPAVLEVAVIGVPDDTWGEAVKAIVALKPGRSATEEELIELTKSELASYMKPRSVEFVESLPKSSTGKILKRELRDQYRR